MTYYTFKKNSFFLAKKGVYVQFGILILAFIAHYFNSRNPSLSESQLFSGFCIMAIVIPLIIFVLSFFMIIANTIWDLIISTKKGEVAKSSWMTMIFNILNFFLFVINFYFTSEYLGGSWN